MLGVWAQIIWPPATMPACGEPQTAPRSLLKGVDEAKDQSYVLSVMGQAELNDVLFPVGEFPKQEVRQMAAVRGLPTASKHDSMDLCFVFDDDYRRFLRSWAAETMRPGPIVDRQGQLFGEHEGLPGLYDRPT